MPDHTDRIVAIQKQMNSNNLKSFISNIVAVIGIYGAFMANGHAIVPLLNHSKFCYALIAAALLVDIFLLKAQLQLTREKSALSGTAKT